MSTAPRRWGATPEEWGQFCTVGLGPELLPCVSNLEATISPGSKMEKLGKVPSLYNYQGHAVGITDWPQRHSTERQLNEWIHTPDYGICLQTRRVKAFDVDIPDAALAQQIHETIDRVLYESGLRRPLPCRYRDNSGKFLLLFATDVVMTKRVMPVGEYGVIELLGRGNQFVAAGTHESGVRYRWTHYPESLEDYRLTPEQIEAVWTQLDWFYASGPTVGGREVLAPQDTADSGTPDPVADWLEAKGLSRGTGSGGQLYVSCPWVSQHGKVGDQTQTVWLTGGTGGYETGHFQCLDAVCAGRTKSDFLDAVGFSVDGFECEPEPETRTLEAFGVVSADDLVGAPPDQARVLEPALERSELTALPKPTSCNLEEILRFDTLTGALFRYNVFTDRIDVTPSNQPAGTRPLEEIDYKLLRSRLHSYEMGRCRFPELELTQVKYAVHVTAHRAQYDPLVDWLRGLTWDGTPRVAAFYARYLGCTPTLRTTADSLYLWTALAGRALVPGIQADMMPVWVGAQGSGKSRTVMAMVPEPTMFGELNLNKYDDPETWRKMRGKVLLEVNELRGFKSRDAAEIKSFLTSEFEEYRSLYTEETRQRRRRCVFVGTTNDDQFLVDETGHRRFLPMWVGAHQDVDAVRRDRDQLWAEAVSIFEQSGVLYRDAEELAKAEHLHFVERDEWLTVIHEWIEQTWPKSDQATAPLTTTLILRMAIGIFELAHQTTQQVTRVRRIMKRLGYTSTRDYGEIRCPYVWKKTGGGR